jgi:hypothetical protein
MFTRLCSAGPSCAGRPSIEEVLDRIDRHRGGRVGIRRAVEDLAEERARQ